MSEMPFQIPEESSTSTATISTAKSDAQRITNFSILVSFLSIVVFQICFVCFKLAVKPFCRLCGVAEGRPFHPQLFFLLLFKADNRFVCNFFRSAIIQELLLGQFGEVLFFSQEVYSCQSQP